MHGRIFRLIAAYKNQNAEIIVVLGKDITRLKQNRKERQISP